MRISDWSSDAPPADGSGHGRCLRAGHRRHGPQRRDGRWSRGHRGLRGEATAALRRLNQPKGTNRPTPAGTAEEIPPPRRSEEHTSELQSLMRISDAVFCLKKKNKII